MRIEELNERLRSGILVADGAMGSLLYDSVGQQRSVEELNSTHADSVFRVHQAYVEAGSQIIETNTFSANRHKLTQLGMGDRVAELNHRGVKIAREAREAAKHEVLIAGSIGPIGTRLQARPLPADEVMAIFREQAGALEERGVDLFMLETFSDVDELLAAIDAIRSFSKLPIVANVTFSEEGTTFGGKHPGEAWQQLKTRNIQVVGTNCTVGPQLLLPIVREFAQCASLPLSAMPNAGFPQRIGDRTVYPKSSPEYFALFAGEAAGLGARIIGGCCGTTPDHIRAMAEAIKKFRPGAAPAGAHGGPAGVEILEQGARSAGRSRARARESPMEQNSGADVCGFRGDRSAQRREPRPHSRASRQSDVFRQGRHNRREQRHSGARRYGRPGSFGRARSPRVRDRSSRNHARRKYHRLASHAAGRMGRRRRPQRAGDHRRSSIGRRLPGNHWHLRARFHRLGAGDFAPEQGHRRAGKNLGGATNFTIGVAVNPVAENIDEELRRFEAKVEAGAHFAMTQPIFDPQHWHDFLLRLGGKSPIPIVVGLWPLTSYKQALRLNNEVPGIVIPNPVLHEMEKAGDSARDTGFKLARRMLDWARTARTEGIAGAYLIPPFKRYEEILEMFD